MSDQLLLLKKFLLNLAPLPETEWERLLPRLRLAALNTGDNFVSVYRSMMKELSWPVHLNQRTRNMKKHTRVSVVSFLLIGVIFTSCREDVADRELDWSCADTKARPHPTATPECLAKIESEQPLILNYYNAVPVSENGSYSALAMKTANTFIWQVRKR